MADSSISKQQCLLQKNHNDDGYVSLPTPDLEVHLSDPPRSLTPLSNSSVNARKRNHRCTFHGDAELVCKSESNINVCHERIDHPGKRSRQADSLFNGTSDAELVNNVVLKSSRRKSTPPRSKHKTRAPIHPSKFIEGSMHDRVSEQPPSLYTTREELAMEDYVANQADMSRRDSESSDFYYDAGIESVKSSGMYRFGKALANAFNPVVVWHGLNGMWKDKPDGRADSDHTIIQDQRTKAEKAYTELKYDGFRGTLRAPKLRHSVDLSSIKREDTDASQVEPQKGSSIDADGYWPSTERKRDGRIFITDQSLMPPPPLRGSVRSPSPFSDAGSSRRSSFHLQRPSLTGLKKVRSHFQISPSKRNLASPAPTPSVESNHSDITYNEKALRKEPSKKDLQKQQKLSKKVSDLETQLEIARRDLWLVKNEIPPVPVLSSRKTPKRFIPGSLPSLPSERLLNNENRPIHETGDYEKNLNYFDANPAVAQATTAVIEAALGVRPKKEIDEKSNKRYVSVTRNTSFHEPETVVPAQPKKSGSNRKRSGSQSIIDSTLKYESEDDNDGEWQPATKSGTNMNAGRKKKSQKLGKDGSPRARKPNLRSSRNLSKVINQTSVSSTEGLPFDPENVDKAKILAMRSNPGSTEEFGKLTDDVVNLRKEFPNITNDQLVRYITALLNHDKKSSTGLRSAYKVATTASQQDIPTRVTSLSHHDQPPLPILGRPRPVSRDMAGPRKSKSFVSLSSSDMYAKMAEEQLQNSLSANGDTVMVSPAKDRKVPPVPILPKELESQACKVHVEPGMEKEEYQWDPDVF